MKTLTLLALLLAAPAFADEPPTDASGCNGRKAGDSCKTDAGADGACEARKCSRIDYSKSPPGSREVDCLICVATKPKTEKKGAETSSRRWLGVGLGGVVLLAGLGVAYIRRREACQP